MAYTDFPDTVAVGPGSADALGDDQAQRSTAWGAIDESTETEGDGPGLLAWLLWPLVAVGAIAAAAVWLP